jgi:hypothetical protein
LFFTGATSFCNAAALIFSSAPRLPTTAVPVLPLPTTILPTLIIFAGATPGDIDTTADNLLQL